LKVSLASLLVVSILVLGVSQTSFGEIISIETDKSEYFIDDQIKVSVTVDDIKEIDMTVRITTPNGNNIVDVAQSGYRIDNVYEIITSEINGEIWKESGNYILTVIQDSENKDIRISFIAENSINPNRPTLTEVEQEEIEIEEIITCQGTDVLVNGACVNPRPSQSTPTELLEIQVNELRVDFEELKKENLELKLENRELKQMIENLRDVVMEQIAVMIKFFQ